MSHFQRHFFVCQNVRPPGAKPSCGACGGKEVLAALERALAEAPPLWGRVTITGTACLGPCFDGPTVVVYPEGVWYGPVTPADAEELAREHLVEGRVVDRLRYRWPEEPG